MKRIAIVLPDLRGGGAERLHVHLANDWVSRGYNVEFILKQGEGELLSLLAPEIEVHDLAANRIRDVLLPLRRHLKNSKPDIVLVAMWPLTSTAIVSWLLSNRCGKLFVSDHNPLSISCIKELGVSATALKVVLGITYPLASHIIAVSHGVKTDLRNLGRLADDDIQVIYNPAATGVSSHRESLDVQKQLWECADDTFHILSAGSLKPQKDHETLIRAIALIPEHINIKLAILGEGPLRENLEHLVAQLSLESRVTLPGYVIDPYPWFRSADLFALSSLREGFGNVLVEALECGIPVISTDCPCGPAEILENGRYGALVPVGDPTRMAAAIEAAIGADFDREALIERAKVFSLADISAQYLECFFGAGN